jgi:hypothetical protein
MLMQAEEAAFVPELQENQSVENTFSGKLVAASSQQRSEPSRATDLDTISELREMNEVSGFSHSLSRLCSFLTIEYTAGCPDLPAFQWQRPCISA